MSLFWITLNLFLNLFFEKDPALTPSISITALVATWQVMFSRETSTASKKDPTNGKAVAPLQETHGCKGVALALHVTTSSLTFALCCLGGFQDPATANPKKRGLNSVLSLLWAGGWTRWLPVVPATFPSPRATPQISQSQEIPISLCRVFIWICFPVIYGELRWQTLQ